MGHEWLYVIGSWTILDRARVPERLDGKSLGKVAWELRDESQS